jgi:hypothetical protein
VDTVDLAIKMTADASDAADAFDQVGSSASAMADDVAAAAGQADTATRDLAGGVDTLGSSSSQAAGGLGDLGGALSLMPGPLGAVGGGMTALQPAIMGAAGASDLLSLAMNSTAVQTAKAKAQAAAMAVKTVAMSAASKAAAATQWLLNAAMAANPIGLLVVAVAAAVAGFILLYKKSDTFRALVNKVGEIGQKAIGFIVDKAKTLGEKLDDLLEPVGGLSGAVEAIGDVGKKAFELWLTPLRLVIGLIKDIIDWISKIKIPDLGALGDVFRSSSPGLEPTTGGIVRHTPAGWTQVNVTINGAVDKLGTARELDKLLTGYGLVQGRIAGP